MKKCKFLFVTLATIMIGCSQEDIPLQNMEDIDARIIPKAHLWFTVPDTTKDVSMSLIKNVAMHALNTKGSRAQTKTIANISPVTDDKGDKVCFAVNYENGGYALVSATKQNIPLLAYSDDGYFDINSIKESGVSVWLDLQKEITDNYYNQPDSIRNQIISEWMQYDIGKKDITMGGSRSDDIMLPYRLQDAMAEWEAQGYAVYSYQDYRYTGDYYNNQETYENLISQYSSQMINMGYDLDEIIFFIEKISNSTSSKNTILSTRWSQINGFNANVPNYDPHHPGSWPIGCVAVALGQIMRYHQKPIHIYWNGMQNYYPTSVTASFLYQVAREARTRFNIDLATSNINDALNAIHNLGPYSNSMISNYTYPVVKSDLDQNRPVFMSGSKSTGTGHAWVCDGYQQSITDHEISIMMYEGDYYTMAGSNYFARIYRRDSHYEQKKLHMNWGWHGQADGLYDYSLFNPTTSNGDGTYTQDIYNTNLQIIHGIY